MARVKKQKEILQKQKEILQKYAPPKRTGDREGQE